MLQRSSHPERFDSGREFYLFACNRVLRAPSTLPRKKSHVLPLWPFFLFITWSHPWSFQAHKAPNTLPVHVVRSDRILELILPPSYPRYLSVDKWWFGCCEKEIVDKILLCPFFFFFFGFVCLTVFCLSFFPFLAVYRRAKRILWSRGRAQLRPPPRSMTCSGASRAQLAWTRSRGWKRRWRRLRLGPR